jgi:sulfonate transport system ATP-binding protein
LLGARRVILARESRSSERASAASVSVRGLDKAYSLDAGRRVAALSGIDLEVPSGEIVTIVGASGSGKSTLLRIIAGLTSADRGSVLVGGERVTGPGLDRGLVFQESRLFPWMTVERNVAFGVADRPRSEREQNVAELIERVGLRGFERAYPHELSGGMAQRVAIARALATHPPVLLLDEPFGALDALTKLRMQGELLRIWHAERTTLVLVTHDVEEAVFLGRRVVVLSARPGRVRRVFEIDLERPRDRSSPAFTDLRRRVLAELSSDDDERQMGYAS